MRLGIALLGGLVGLALPPAPASGDTFCGNGTIESPPELCDDGNQVSGDGCSYPSCLPEACGDGVTNPDVGETCDDGGTAPDDGCDGSCHLECGNGTVEGAETCDDGGESATCDDDCTAVECGDGHVNQTAGEQCEPPGTETCDAACVGIDRPQGPAQRACIDGLNRSALGVVKAQNEGLGSCLKDVASGRQADVAACLAGIDTSKAAGKTWSTDAKKCGGDGLPDFAYTDPQTINASARDGARGAFDAVFGAPPVIADRRADEAGAACQAEVARRQFELQETWRAVANKAKKAALETRKAAPGAVNAAGLAAAIDAAVAGSGKIAKAESRVQAGIARKCPDAGVDGLFDCGGAATGDALALCVIEQAKRGACLALEAADALSLTCPGDA